MYGGRWIENVVVQLYLATGTEKPKEEVDMTHA